VPLTKTAIAIVSIELIPKKRTNNRGGIHSTGRKPAYFNNINICTWWKTDDILVKCTRMEAFLLKSTIAISLLNFYNKDMQTLSAWMKLF